MKFILYLSIDIYQKYYFYFNCRYTVFILIENVCIINEYLSAILIFYLIWFINLLYWDFISALY